ncbi:uncharacterized protein LOC111087114 [Limulus polyphemus]|uniref:Uncharacterized protein LOC111087114 n=1 Tax=Limulus polyphemus TaxID=6850 RepID=A0ABM1SXE7_LIMPO|nr:uncharacterized protein LOC111087114 [Limulus polyphemus]XP_022248304.1 uncharacterized protein LOC111087114 [Limulus polyphemus]
MYLRTAVLMAVFVHQSTLEVVASNIAADDSENSDESREIEEKDVFGKPCVTNDDCNYDFFATCYNFKCNCHLGYRPVNGLCKEVTEEVHKSNLTTAIFSTLGGIILLSVLFVAFVRLLSKKWKEQRRLFTTTASARLQLSTIVERQFADAPLTADLRVLPLPPSTAYSEKPPPSYEEAVQLHGTGLSVLPPAFDASIAPPPYERIERAGL